MWVCERCLTVVDPRVNRPRMGIGHAKCDVGHSAKQIISPWIGVPMFICAGASAGFFINLFLQFVLSAGPGTPLWTRTFWVFDLLFLGASVVYGWKFFKFALESDSESEAVRALKRYYFGLMTGLGVFGLALLWRLFTYPTSY